MKKLLSRLAGMLYFTGCFLFLLSSNAQAYLDPSATTYILQAVAGAAVVIGTVAVMYWHKAKKKVQKALKLDEHSSKDPDQDFFLHSYPPKWMWWHRGNGE